MNDLSERFVLILKLFFLFSVAKYYPKNTIHLVVIDPGVGSNRTALIIQTENYFFVGPDNGVVSLAAANDNIQKVVEISNSTYFLKQVSHTFHGRDIFAPVAAHLALNRMPEEFGSITKSWIKIEIPETIINKNEIFGEIIHIDRFGNILTNISQDILENLERLQEKFLEIKLKNQNWKIPLCTSYNEVKIGEFLGIIGSMDLLEISKNQKSAADALKAQIGEKISVKFSSD